MDLVTARTMRSFLSACVLVSVVGFSHGQDIMYAHGSGVGDSQLPANDDGYSSVIALANPFPFFGSTQSSLYVSQIFLHDFF